ncbi:MAG: hypothetical protein M0Z92_04415 [Actinomycetota bacterium]|nr:hypothetical protein [Actinomycetota bacterium]
MPFYLLTNALGFPYSASPGEFAPGCDVARVGSELRTRQGSLLPATFIVASTPGGTLPDSPDVTSRHAQLFEVELVDPDAVPLRKGQPPRKLRATRVRVAREVSVFLIFGSHAGALERFFATMEAMTHEQWARVHSLFVASETRDVALHGHPGLGRIPRVVKNTAHRGSRVVDELGYLAEQWALDLVDAALSLDERRDLFRASDAANVAARALALGNRLISIVRTDALAPFEAVIGPVWEAPKRSRGHTTSPQSPAVSLAPSPTLTQSVAGEVPCPGI